MLFQKRASTCGIEPGKVHVIDLAGTQTTQVARSSKGSGKTACMRPESAPGRGSSAVRTMNKSIPSLASCNIPGPSTASRVRRMRASLNLTLAGCVGTAMCQPRCARQMPVCKPFLHGHQMSVIPHQVLRFVGLQSAHLTVSLSGLDGSHLSPADRSLATLTGRSRMRTGLHPPLS